MTYDLSASVKRITLPYTLKTLMVVQFYTYDIVNIVFNVARYSIFNVHQKNLNVCIFLGRT